MDETLESERYALVNIKHTVGRVCRHTDRDKEPKGPFRRLHGHASVGVQTVEPTKKLVLYDSPCLGLQMRPVRVSLDSNRHTDITEVADLKAMKEVVVMVLDDVQSLRVRIRSARYTAQAEYSQKLQEKSMELYCRINEKVRDLETIHKKKTEALRRAFRQQLADAISRMHFHYKRKIVDTRRPVDTYRPAVESDIEAKMKTQSLQSFLADAAIQDLQDKLRQAQGDGEKRRQAWLLENAELRREISRLRSITSTEPSRTPSCKASATPVNTAVSVLWTEHLGKVLEVAQSRFPKVQGSLSLASGHPSVKVNQTQKKVHSAGSKISLKASPNAMKRQKVPPLKLQGPTSRVVNRTSALSTERRTSIGDAPCMRTLGCSMPKTPLACHRLSGKTSDALIKEGVLPRIVLSHIERSSRDTRDSEPKKNTRRSRRVRKDTDNSRKVSGKKRQQNKASTEETGQSLKEFTVDESFRIGGTLVETEPSPGNGPKTRESPGNLRGDEGDGLFRKETEIGMHKKRRGGKTTIFSEEIHGKAESRGKRKSMTASHSHEKQKTDASEIKRNSIADVLGKRGLRITERSLELSTRPDHSKDIDHRTELRGKSTIAKHALQQDMVDFSEFRGKMTHSTGNLSKNKPGLKESLRKVKSTTAKLSKELPRMTESVERQISAPGTTCRQVSTLSKLDLTSQIKLTAEAKQITKRFTQITMPPKRPSTLLSGDVSSFKILSETAVATTEKRISKPAKKKQFEFEDVPERRPNVDKSRVFGREGRKGQQSSSTPTVAKRRELLLEEQIRRLERELRTTNQVWEKKYSTLQANLFALKNESYTRHTLQKQAVRLPQPSFSSSASVPKDIPGVLVSGHSPPYTPLPSIPSLDCQRPDSDDLHARRSSLSRGCEHPTLDTDILPLADQAVHYREEDLPGEAEPLPGLSA